MCTLFIGEDGYSQYEFSYCYVVYLLELVIANMFLEYSLYATLLAVFVAAAEGINLLF